MYCDMQHEWSDCLDMYNHFPYCIVYEDGTPTRAEQAVGGDTRLDYRESESAACKRDACESGSR